jgi:membrane protein
MTYGWNTLLRATFSQWNQHDATRVAAALAYYTVLSLAPLVVLAVAVTAFVLGHTRAHDFLLNQASSTLGQQGAEAIKEMIDAPKPASGTVASIVAVVTLLVGASGVFGEIRHALNKMWDVEPRSQGGVWAFLKEHFLSFGMVLAVGFLLLVSLIISAGLAALGQFFGSMLPLPEMALSAINLVISLSGTTFLFALIFREVPDVEIDWKDVWIGGTGTALLFTIGKFLIGLYLGKVAVGSAYGAAGSLVVVIVWVYYSALIFLFGAEFTHLVYLQKSSRSATASWRESKTLGEQGVYSDRLASPAKNPNRLARRTV